MEEHVGLARYTTIGTGGPARWFARPETIDELVDALQWARDQGASVAVIGLGSNVLVHDDGVDGLVLKLAGDLAGARVEGDVLVAGGGAPNAVCLHRARAAGLGGFEFASAIPGTAGGGVRMNAGAYGREWRDVLIDAVV
ncbi:MAG: FAD-binding protein, partial [Gaiellaceae bacterium]